MRRRSVHGVHPDPPVYAYCHGPSVTATVGTSWQTLDVESIAIQQRGFSESTSGEVMVPVSGVYEITASADGVKSTTGSTSFDLRIQHNQSGSFAAPTGATGNGTVNGGSKGGQVAISCVARLDAGNFVRVQVQAADSTDVQQSGYRMTIRRVAP